MVISAIERNQALLIEEIEKKQEATEQRAEEFLRELERENSELQTRSCELQVLENTDDPLYLLQVRPAGVQLRPSFPTGENTSSLQADRR